MSKKSAGWTRGLFFALGFWIALMPLLLADEFHEGNARFGSGDYDSAARSYHLAIDKGLVAAETYYNLGLAQAHAGNSAEASLSFQRALVLNPGLEPPRRELMALVQQAGIEIPEATWTQRFAALVPVAAWWIGGAIAAWIGAFGLLAGLFAQARRGLWITLGALIFLLGKSGLALAWLSDPSVQDRDLAVLTTPGSNRLRSAPVENSETAVSLAGGSTVALISERGNWAYCAALDGKRGWIERSAVQPVIPRKS